MQSLDGHLDNGQLLVLAAGPNKPWLQSKNWETGHASNP